MTVFGPDTSHYQGAVDFSRVAHTEGFVISKVSQGLGLDDRWKANRAGGLHFNVRGGYHFGDFLGNPIAQARFFTAQFGRVIPGDMLWLDCEHTRAPKGTASVNWISAFLTETQRITKLPASRVGIYTGAWWWNPFTGGSGAFGNHPLWVSGYNGANGAITPPAADIPRGFPGAVLWQYTDKAHVAGISTPVDRSVYAGTIAQLRARAGNPIPVPVVVYPGHPLGLGSHGPAVAELRKHLRLPVGLVYDAHVVAAVKAVQLRNPKTWMKARPHVDGICGPVTWRVITGHA